MLLPFAAWAATGFVFFLKPGYGGAYEPLTVRSYPIGREIAITPGPGWREFRVLRTILGDHLLVRTDAGWQHLDAASRAPLPPPAEEQMRALVSDAFAAHPARYGRIASVTGNAAQTDTGVRVTLDWNRLALQQRGRDTDWIDALYRVHYLQWTGVAAVDRVLGFLGLTLVIALTALGARLAWR